ncbi:MAG: glycerophosphodiester phosphodiesterase [Planctomycetota bacterium]
MQIVAHRGVHSPAGPAENTLDAFAAAVALGVDWFELDCRLSRDGELVVIHDETVDRTTSRLGRVATFTAAELAEEGVPLLAQALQLATAQTGALVEVKCDDEASDAPRLALAVRAALGGCANVAVQTFSSELCALLACEWLVQPADHAGPPLLDMALALGATGLNPHHEWITADRVAALHAHGLTVSAWTVNDESHMRELLACGVDRVITDQPELALRVRRQWP